jgi:hypothetical protein
MTGNLPPVPILIDAAMPESHRRALELLAPDGVEIVERPWFTTARVREFWFSSTPSYPPIRPKAAQWDPFAHDPAVYAPILREMVRRLERAIPPRRGPDKVYLARSAFQHRKFVNAAAIEEILREAGFVVAHPQDLSFAEQFRLVRDASFVLGSEGSAMFLCFFNRPGGPGFASSTTLIPKACRS